MPSKIVMVDTISSFRIRYAIRLEENDPNEYAVDTVVCNEYDPERLREFSQEHIGFHIFSHREVSEEEYLRMFDEDNDYAKDWDKEKKLAFISDK
jgi:hypothetical protein